MNKTDKDFSKIKTLSLADLTGQPDDAFIITENTLYLEGEINPDSAKSITSYIIEANFPSPDLPPLGHINLFINSPGGCMASTFAMISVIRASNIPVRTIALGSCASGGLMLAISGHIRLVDKYCSIMSHTLSTGFPDFAKHEDLDNWLKSVKVETKKIVDLYKENTNLAEEQIEASLLPKQQDVYLTAEQAISFGLFDDYFTTFESLK
jgi:ATP-dependent protease ClpP protease subunit